MTAKDIDEKINNGIPLIVTFYIRSIDYQIGSDRISKKKFEAAKNRFNGRLLFKNDFSGITKHYYTLIK